MLVFSAGQIYALLISIVFFGVVLMLARASSHMLVVDWRRSRSPTPIAPGLWPTDRTQTVERTSCISFRGIDFSKHSSGFLLPTMEEIEKKSYPFGFEPWYRLSEESGENLYHRLFIQNSEDVDLLGDFILEVTSSSNLFLLDKNSQVVSSLSNTAEAFGVRVFAGPSDIEIGILNNGFRLFFRKISAETAWTIEWRLKHAVDLEVKIWECANSNTDEPSKELFRPLDLIKLNIPATSMPRSASSVKRPSLFEIVASGFFSFSLYIAVLYAFVGFQSPTFWTAFGVFCSGLLSPVAAFFIVRRELPPFSQGFLIPSYVAIRKR